MTPAMIERVAQQFRALGEASRLRLLSLLFDGERTVSELVAASGLSFANVSKQLGLLHRAGWIERRKEGLNVVYALSDRRTLALCELMCDRVRRRAAAEASLAQGRATSPAARAAGRVRGRSAPASRP